MNIKYENEKLNAETVEYALTIEVMHSSDHKIYYAVKDGPFVLYDTDHYLNVLSFLKCYLGYCEFRLESKRDTKELSTLDDWLKEEGLE